ncbi:MAG: tryptophan halogenase family protein [Myxococcota bacterium]
MSKAIKRIVVVGGGSAGWLSAAFLNRALGGTVDVTLIESPNIPRIGVGEATVPTLRHTMNYLGFDDHEWMAACSATYKLAIRFEQWNQPIEEGAEGFYHPFFERTEPLVKTDRPFFPEVGEGISLMHYWNQRRLSGDTTPYAHAVFPNAKLCDSKKGPRESLDSKPDIQSAFHVDAAQLAQFLARASIERGVKHVVGNVVEVTLSETGSIESVVLESGERVQGDLFVDCTGFRSVLLGGALQEPFLSDGGSLFCDAAVAMHADNRHEDGLAPYSSAPAGRAGWMWDIPLLERAGTGYVYSRAHLTPSEAETELRRYVGERVWEDVSVKHLTFRPGRRERSWVGNCVAIGLASSFIEPLESTTIFLIEYSLAQLVALLPNARMSTAFRKRYNQNTARMYEEIRDFIVMHYVLSRRTDTPFWRDVKSHTLVPSGLRDQLEFYRESLPHNTQLHNFVFRERSYACVLAGLGYLPEQPLPLLNHQEPSAADAMFVAVQEETARLLHTLPSHDDLLEQIHGVRPSRRPVAGVA